ncbi:MAG: sulfotransferase family protein [Vulcanimicrobiota bacterium]
MQDLIIVTGLPRSGTSLLMSMLAAGGLPVLSDSRRPADEHNPRGYFEDSRVLALNSGAVDWLRQHPGHAVKILYRQLELVEADVPARILLLERDLHEVVASQQRMLAAQDHDWLDLFGRELRRFKGWLARRGWPVLLVPHRSLLQESWRQAAEIQDFLGVSLDLQAMVAQVDPSLYRCRSC